MTAPGMGAGLPPSAGTATSITTADGRSIELAVTESSQRALNDILKAGTVVSGRVLEHFHGDQYLINLRGRNIIAASSQTLLRDSIVRFAVLGTEGGLRLRLADGGSTDSAQTSAPAQRLQALGLPDTVHARLVLTAFEDSGAPLAPPTRLHQATTAVTSAANQGLSIGQQLQLAAAHALLAQARLPVTPALLALAQRALQAPMGQAAQSLQTLANNPLGNAPSTTSHPGAQSSPGPTAAASSGGGQPPTTANPTSPLAANAAPAHPVPGNPGPASNPGSAPQQAAPANATPIGLSAASTTPSTPPSNATGTAVPASEAPPQGAGNELRQPAQTTTAQAITWAQTTSHFHDLARGPRQALANALASLGIHPPAAAPTTTAPQPGLSAPPPANEPPAAGLPSAMPPPEVELGSLIRQMADILHAQREESQPFRLAAQSLAREVLGEALLPPRTLAEYDLVLPLPLFDQREPVPSRLAISGRRVGHIEATFLRIDVELSRLGPLSLRFTDATGSPVSITIFHTAQAGKALSVGVNDLQADLAAQGFEHSLRLVDFADDV